VRRAIWIVGLLSVSCSSGSSESRQPAESEAAEQGREPPAPEGTAPASAGGARSDAAPAPARPAVDPSACAADADCTFEDPCDPGRCVATASVPEAVGCEKSRPPTGTCVCFENRCSLKPGPSHPKMAVDTDCNYTEGCALDRAAGRCAPGRDDDPRPQPMVGPRCDCDSKVPQRCHYSWLDPVACSSVEDCWVEHLPYAHPIKRPRSKKGKKFRPCKDGERAPACEKGTCTLLAYGC
jgi:hypothetical protein